MAYNDISRVDARRFMSRPPRAYRQLSQNEKAMVAEWEPRQGAKGSRAQARVPSILRLPTHVRSSDLR